MPVLEPVPVLELVPVLEFDEPEFELPLLVLDEIELDGPEFDLPLSPFLPSFLGAAVGEGDELGELS